MLLSDILKRLSENKNEADFYYKCFDVLPESVDIKDVTCSSGECSEGSVFVCIKGEKYDGHDYIGKCEALGTSTFVSERRDLKLKRGIVIISRNARKTMAELSKIVYEIPNGALFTVGITGTKGKSTTAELLADTLRRLGIKTLSVGTLGAYFDKRYETKNTTPDSPLLYSLMRKAYEWGARAAVIEVSSQALKAYRVWGIKFDIVAFTSFGFDHIGKGEHRSLADYIRTKRSLFTSYGARVAVVNYDDAYSAFFSSGFPEVIKCGSERGADYKITRLREGFFGMRFSLSGIEKCYKLTGKFNASNIAIAAAIAEKFSKMPLEKILDIMSELRVKGRFECYNIRSRFAIIDYAHNEKSFRELLLSIRRLTSGRIISVFGSVGGRSKNRRRELAKTASELSDFSVITSDNPDFEYPYEIAEEIYSFYPEKEKAKIVTDRKRAICEAFALSKPRDVILLLGKGHEEYMISEGERVKFSEKELLMKIKIDSNFDVIF